MHQGCEALVRNAAGKSNRFWSGGWATSFGFLSPYPFLLLMDVMTEDARKDIPGSIMFADDIVVLCHIVTLC